MASHFDAGKASRLSHAMRRADRDGPPVSKTHFPVAVANSSERTPLNLPLATFSFNSPADPYIRIGQPSVVMT